MSDSFLVEATEALTLDARPPLSDTYTLSPFVWRKDRGWEMLVRSVPRRNDMPALKISSVYYGTSRDGLRFAMQDQPALAPGPEPEDRDGCEDPTVSIHDGVYYVYYSGWNQEEGQGRLLLASGPDCDHLEKRGVRLASTSEIANPKEVTIVQASDGTWRLFFEYAADGASQIGLASSPNVDGPWTILPPPFAARPGRWDAWHLSTGPILNADPSRPVLIYNGATRDAHWRIGWVQFNADYTQVLARSEEPLIMPPPQTGDRTDIAFSASAVEQGDTIFLYYSIADQEMVRATLHRS